MNRRLCLLVLTLSGVFDAQANSVRVVAAGASLGELLSPYTYALSAVDGALPAALSEPPRAPLEPGLHWVALYAQDASDTPTMIAFSVAGEADGARQDVPLTVDQTPPQAQLEFSARAANAPESIVVSQDSVVNISLSDPAGSASYQLRVDDKPAEAATFARALTMGSHRVEVHAQDRLGNAGTVATVAVQVDTQGPAIAWQVVDQIEGVPAGVVGARKAMLQVRAEDQPAGVKSLSVSDGSRVWNAASERSVLVPVGARTLSWQASDEVGNVSTGVLPVQRDLQGPVAALLVDGVLQPGPSFSLPRGARFTIEISDAPAGVASACVMYRSRQCEPLSREFVGADSGTFKIKLFAEDRLGNRSRRELKVKVVR